MQWSYSSKESNQPGTLFSCGNSMLQVLSRTAFYAVLGESLQVMPKKASHRLKHDLLMCIVWVEVWSFSHHFALLS